MNKCFFAVFFFLFSINVFATEVIVNVNNIDSASGNISIGFCTNEAEFLEQKPVAYGFTIPASKGSISKVVDVPSGSYAIIVYHDTNGDKILNKGMFGKPTEQYGFSNNKFGAFGKKPPFQDALFNVESTGTVINIDLR